MSDIDGETMTDDELRALVFRVGETAVALAREDITKDTYAYGMAKEAFDAAILAVRKAGVDMYRGWLSDQSR